MNEQEEGVGLGQPDRRQILNQREKQRAKEAAQGPLPMPLADVLHSLVLFPAQLVGVRGTAGRKRPKKVTAASTMIRPYQISCWTG